MYFLALFVVTFVVAIVQGLTGVGGSIIVLPILLYHGTYTIQQAAGIMIVSSLIPAGLPAGIQYIRHGAVPWTPVIILTVSGVLGMLLGSSLALNVHIPTTHVFRILAFMMAVSTAYVVVQYC